MQDGPLASFADIRVRDAQARCSHASPHAKRTLRVPGSRDHCEGVASRHRHALQHSLHAPPAGTRAGELIYCWWYWHIVDILIMLYWWYMVFMIVDASILRAMAHARFRRGKKPQMLYIVGFYKMFLFFQIFLFLRQQLSYSENLSLTGSFSVFFLLNAFDKLNFFCLWNAYGEQYFFCQYKGLTRRWPSKQLQCGGYRGL